MTESARKNRRGRNDKYKRLSNAIRKEAKREGAFSNTPRWGVQSRTHTSSGVKGRNPYWDNPKFKTRRAKKKAIIKVNSDGTLDQESLREYLLKRNRKRRMHQFKDANLSDRDLTK